METIKQIYRNNGQSCQTFMIVGEIYNGYIDFNVYTYFEDENLYSDDEDQSEDRSDIEPYLSGSVKWDGCSNWCINENKGCMLHFCCKEDMFAPSRLMAACFDIAVDCGIVKS